MNTSANIDITTDGASEAAAGLDQVANGFDKVGRQHNELKNKFQERFQHIGLQIFAGEALQAAGAGTEARAVVNVLNTGLTTLIGGAVGAASGIMIAVTALTALAGIISKVIEHQHKLSEETKRQITENEALIKSYEKSSDTLKTYAENVAKMPGYIRQWGEAERELSELTLKRQGALLMETVTSLNFKIAKQQQEIDATKADIATRQEWLRVNAAQIAADKNYADNTGNSVSIVTALTKKLGEQEMAMQRDSAMLKKATADLSALHHGYASAGDAAERLSAAAKSQGEAASKAAQEAADAETARYQSWAEQHAKQMQALQKEVNDEAELETKRYQHWAELREKQKTLNHEMLSIEKDAYNTIVGEQSKAFAKMIVDGESFSNVTKNMWKDLARQVIAQIEAMIVKYTVLMALTGGTGTFGGGSVLGKVFGMAEGGSVMVNKPTIFLAGEAGQPEIATFTPLSKMGGASIGSPRYLGSDETKGSLTIGSIITNINGITDPSAIAAKVGDAIVTRIRSRGDLNFVRA